MSVHNKDAYPLIKEVLGIPEDEPIFILRAQDRFALPTVARYNRDVMSGSNRPDAEWQMQMNENINEFAIWQQHNDTKVPD